MKEGTLFLDRDGVINKRIEGDYVTKPEEFEILPGVLSALAKLAGAGFRLAIVTNQRGVAIERMTMADVARVHEHLKSQAAKEGVRLDEIYVCPHDRNDGCTCRKPKPGLLEQADRTKPVDWSQAYMIGDSDSDILAGKAKGIRTIKIGGHSSVGADFEFRDLPSAARFLLED